MSADAKLLTSVAFGIFKASFHADKAEAQHHKQDDD
jgi:hypothetical protein